jgi:hypothetical protein
MSTEESESFEAELEAVYRRYRHRSVESSLDDIAETMEETILQRVLAEEFLETEVEIDEEAKQAVRDAQELVKQGQYDKLDERIGELIDTVEDQERRLSNRIQEARIEMSNTVNGMIRLNERVNRVDPTRLEAIKSLLDDWDWKEQVYHDEDETIEGHKRRAASYGRDMRRFFEDARDDIFGPYNGTPVEDIVEGLLNDERFTLENLSDEELTRLRESDLESYVELKLS